MIKYPEEIRQADIIKKLQQLQAKADRRKRPISKHYSREEDATSSILRPQKSTNHHEIPDQAA